ncbi:unnamed protein product [Oppiella nova]|uniref:CUB domain-containing protein n=1 Tax=Oppiella nova TaxID=334625 RepID=A0A7R9LPV2_9ACAR|nr:unnamed protein product [Oppiella nova]CAG2165425.1 unnamed protein product [Oppiella nova]
MDVLMAVSEPYSIFLLVYCALIAEVSVPAVRAVNTKCDCVVFDETFGKEFGVFTSPNWPVPYVDNINCLLYSFLADSHQIVEITFDEFDVQKTTIDCEYGDFVKLFLHLDAPGVNEKTAWNSILCGKIADIEQTHYSSHSNLIFEFRSDWRNANNTGFRGTYRFLDKQMFRTDGELIAKSKCDYKFVSTATTNGTVRSRGRFYSPQYPSTYPKNTDYVELVSTGPVLFVQFLSRSHTPGQGFKGKFIFDTIASGAKATGADIPSTEGPRISTGGKTVYIAGEVVLANCTSAKSKPGAYLNFTINDEPVGAEHDVEYSTTLHADGLETSSLSLRFKAQDKHFLTTSGHMTLKCTSTISRLYKIKNEAQLILYNKNDKQQQQSGLHIMNSENLSQEYFCR